MNGDPQRARALLDLLESTLRRSGAPVPRPRRAAAAAEPAEPADRAAFERAVVADALEQVDRDIALPSSDKVRIYLRPGRRYTRVFWEYLGSRSGSILHFVEHATGRVFRAKSWKQVGAPTDRVIRVADAPRPAEPAIAQPADDNAPTLAEVLRHAEPLTPQRVFAALGMPKAVRTKRERRSGIQVRKHGRKAVSVEWTDWGGEGDAVRRQRFDEALERLAEQGYGLHLLSGETGAAAREEGRKRGIVLVHRSKSSSGEGKSTSSPASSSSSGSRLGVVRPTPTREQHPDLTLKGMAPGQRVSVDGEVYRVRSVAGGSPTLSIEAGKGTGPDLYELKHETSGRIARLRVPGVVERVRDDASPFAGTIVVTFGAKSSFGDERTVYGPRVERLSSASSPRAKEASAKPPPVDLAQALETARAHGRAVVQLGQVNLDAPAGQGSKALESFRTVLASALDALRERPVVERRAFVDQTKRAYREAVALAQSVQGEGWRAGGEALLRRGTHAQIFTEDLDRAFKALDVPRRYVLESAIEIEPAAEASSKSAEVWERDRVVWFRPIDQGHAERRVELRRGDTAWVSLGKRDGQRRGFWASVNGISQTRRALKMDRQWVELPLVFARSELEGEAVPPPPGGAEPAEGAFAELLEGLRTRRVRSLAIVSTDHSPHRMTVTRVESRPGVVVVEGKVKRSKATLTIPTAVDAKGRPAKFASLERGRSRANRVDPNRITAAGASRAAPPSPPATDAAANEPDARAPTGPGGRPETPFQKERRENAERKAARLGRQAEAQWESARAETAAIPMGQPILVGHHSERRHRKALANQDRKARQALETARAAESAESAAAAAGYAISSDDPDAIAALDARLAELEASRELSKAVNAAYRKGGWEAVAKVPGTTPKLIAGAKRTLELAPWMKKPMDVTNLGANIRRVRQRIEELKAAAEQAEAPPIVGVGFAIEEDPVDNRIRFRFDERPDKETITKMKRAGFRWSRRHGAWQRQLNTQGRHAAERMAKELFGWSKTAAAEPTDEAPEAAARWQARVAAEHAELMRRREREQAQGPPAPSPTDDEVFERLRTQAAITDADRRRYPADVIEEAEGAGLRPERVLELRAMSEREEAEMGRKLRAAARREEAVYPAEKTASRKPNGAAALAQLAEALAPLTNGTRETRSGQSRLSGPLLGSAERTPHAKETRAALLVLLEAAKRCPTKAARNRLRKEVSAHLKLARRHADRLAQKFGAGSREVRDARAVRDLLDQARAELAKGA